MCRPLIWIQLLLNKADLNLIILKVCLIFLFTFFLLLVKHLMHIIKHVVFCLWCALPLNWITKLFNCSALFKIQVAFSHEAKHLKAHFILALGAVPVQVNKVFQFLSQWCKRLLSRRVSRHKLINLSCDILNEIPSLCFKFFWLLLHMLHVLH